MSLDVYLSGFKTVICECGREVRIESEDDLYWRNITHNLNKMAASAGIYEPLWRPDEMSPPITKASELIPLLSAGLDLLVSDPERFKKDNPPNGWGDYDGFVDFVRSYLDACRNNPDAAVRVSR